MAERPLMTARADRWLAMVSDLKFAGAPRLIFCLTSNSLSGGESSRSVLLIKRPSTTSFAYKCIASIARNYNFLSCLTGEATKTAIFCERRTIPIEIVRGRFAQFGSYRYSASASPFPRMQKRRKFIRIWCAVRPPNLTFCHSSKWSRIRFRSRLVSFQLSSENVKVNLITQTAAASERTNEYS